MAKRVERVGRSLSPPNLFKIGASVHTYSYLASSLHDSALELQPYAIIAIMAMALGALRPLEGLRICLQRFSLSAPSLRLQPPSPSSRYSLFSHLLPLVLPAAVRLGLPSLGSIWESILRAVPKKKTSHRKKRQRFLAGKALKDVTELNRCSACGNVKKAHVLCPFCVRGMA